MKKETEKNHQKKNLGVFTLLFRIADHTVTINETTRRSPAAALLSELYVRFPHRHFRNEKLENYN